MGLANFSGYTPPVGLTKICGKFTGGPTFIGAGQLFKVPIGLANFLGYAPLRETVQNLGYRWFYTQWDLPAFSYLLAIPTTGGGTSVVELANFLGYDPLRGIGQLLWVRPPSRRTGQLLASV